MVIEYSSPFDVIPKACGGLLISMGLLAAGPTVCKNIESYMQESEKLRAIPIVRRVHGITTIEASSNLKGVYPLQGFDYNNDGQLDKVEQYLHGFPRIPFGSWHTLQKSDVYYNLLQKEYEIALRSENYTKGK